MLFLLLASVPVALAGLLTLGVVYQQRGLGEDERHHPAPGRMVRTPTGLLHLHESPALQSRKPGQPTVVLESGLAGSSLSWALVQNEVSAFAPVCSYDRAGFGWSQPVSSPRTLPVLVEELRQLLQSATIPPPYVLVGHSFGGLLVRAFAAEYPDLVLGLVLVDPVSTAYWVGCAPAEQARLQRGITLARRGAILARLGVIRFVLNLLLAGSRFLPGVVGRFSAPGAQSFLKRLTRQIQQLPPHLWPIVRAQWSRPGGLLAIATYLESLRGNCAWAEKAKWILAVPTTVLSAGTATPLELAERDRWLLSNPLASHVRLPAAGHWVQLQQPQAVIDAIQDMVRTPPPNFLLRPDQPNLH